MSYPHYLVRSSTSPLSSRRRRVRGTTSRSNLRPPRSASGIIAQAVGVDLRPRGTRQPVLDTARATIRTVNVLNLQVNRLYHWAASEADDTLHKLLPRPHFASSRTAVPGRAIAAEVVPAHRHREFDIQCAELCNGVGHASDAARRLSIGRQSAQAAPSRAAPRMPQLAP